LGGECVGCGDTGGGVTDGDAGGVTGGDVGGPVGCAGGEALLPGFGEFVGFGLTPLLT
jgi:hypothetical protein